MTLDQQGKDISVCLRLREERKARRLDQQDIADALGVTTKTVGRWEKNIAIPSDKLAELSAQGIDVMYVVTGARAAQVAGLDEHESQLLEAFRNMSKQQQDAVLLLSSSLSSSSGKPPLADKP